ncbi:MAG: hypothetical protein ACRD0N_15245 [Acidimicrobiales bacterium]
MADVPRVVTAADFDEMTPDERASAVAEGVVTDWSEVPSGFRDRIVDTARRLSTDSDSAAG